MSVLRFSKVMVMFVLEGVLSVKRGTGTDLTSGVSPRGLLQSKVPGVPSATWSIRGSRF